MHIVGKIPFKKKLIHMQYGFIKIVDGLIVVLSLGNLHSDLAFKFIIKAAKKYE